MKPLLKRMPPLRTQTKPNACSCCPKARPDCCPGLGMAKECNPADFESPDPGKRRIMILPDAAYLGLRSGNPVTLEVDQFAERVFRGSSWAVVLPRSKK